jgi:hypothetical protein
LAARGGAAWVGRLSGTHGACSPAPLPHLRRGVYLTVTPLTHSLVRRRASPGTSGSPMTVTPSMGLASPSAISTTSGVSACSTLTLRKTTSRMAPRGVSRFGGGRDDSQREAAVPRASSRPGAGAGRAPGDPGGDAATGYAPGVRPAAPLQATPGWAPEHPPRAPGQAGSTAAGAPASDAVERATARRGPPLSPFPSATPAAIRTARRVVEAARALGAEALQQLTDAVKVRADLFIARARPIGTHEVRQACLWVT